MTDAPSFDTNNPLRIGTRRSPLAMAQAQMAASAICLAHSLPENAVMEPVEVEGTHLFKADGGRIELPVAHAEGRFVPRSEEVTATLEDNRQIVVRYVNPDGSEAEYPENPNGSVDGVAGITDLTGRVLGLMPHPERYLFERHHPRWTRGEGREPGDGRRFFENAVKALG